MNFPQKYYATDLGLRNARQNFSQLEKPHLMENLIYNELVARGYDVNVGVVSRCNSGQQKGPLEIDFMVDTGLSRVYVQSAFQLEDERKIRQETASLKSCNDSFKKIVVTWGYQQPLPDNSGIIFVGLIPFLTGMEKILG